MTEKSKKNSTQKNQKEATQIVDEGEIKYSMELLRKTAEEKHLPKILELIVANPADRGLTKKHLEEDVADLAIANLLFLALSGDDNKTKLEATNSLLDRLNKPRMSAQYKKSESTNLTHADLMKVLTKKKKFDEEEKN